MIYGKGITMELVKKVMGHGDGAIDPPFKMPMVLTQLSQNECFNLFKN